MTELDSIKAWLPLQAKRAYFLEQEWRSLPTRIVERIYVCDKRALLCIVDRDTEAVCADSALLKRFRGLLIEVHRNVKKWVRLSREDVLMGGEIGDWRQAIEPKTIQGFGAIDLLGVQYSRAMLWALLQTTTLFRYGASVVVDGPPILPFRFGRTGKGCLASWRG